MWQKSTFDLPAVKREMKMAAEVGYNSCRVFLPFIVWWHEREGFLERFGAFLEAAAVNGVSVMPILFDDCAFAGKEPYYGPQDAPVMGVHNSGWTPSPGSAAADDPLRFNDLEAYIKTILTAHKNDNRIIVWDLYNEPGNNDRGEKSLPLLENAFTWARECGVSQPLTVAVWSGAGYESRFNELSDIVSFHEYGDLNKAEQTITRLKRYNRPLFCTEWLNRPLGSGFETHLPIWKSENIAAYQWGLVTGKTQTYLHWDNTKNNPMTMPEVWQHDLLHPDGKPYDPKEMEYIKKCVRQK
jgi:hypothetical protein